MKQARLFHFRTFFTSLISIFLLVTYSGQLVGQSNFKGYDGATCKGLQADNFLKNWLILGPIEIMGKELGQVNDSILKEAFEKDILTSVMVDPGKSVLPLKNDGKAYEWKNYTSKTDIVELYKVLGEKDNILCYALSEIVMPGETKALIGLGSDDAVKVWINGKLVHKNFIARAVNIDDDLFEISLNKGSNQVLIKIENAGLGYGFSFRPLGKDIISDLVIANSGSGNLDKVKTLMRYHPDLTKTNFLGLTAWQMAVIKGRTPVAEYLEKNGAEKITDFPAIDEFVDRMMKPLEGSDSVPGAAVLIARDGKILFDKGYGNANIEKGIPVKTDIKFRIGSITKQFTAAAILHLQEQGKISVSDTLSEYIPGFPRGNEVTIYQLLTHTSGIHSFTNRPDFRELVVKPVSDTDVLKLIESDTFDFDPGEHFSYNNSGYFILGYLVSQISGMSYSDYLSETFFNPLGMHNTGVYDNAHRPGNEATGYGIDNGKIVTVPDWDLSWAGGAGELYSTVDDLFTWNEAIFSGKVLNPSSLKMAFTPAVLKNGEPTGGMIYGFGWMLPEYRGMKFIAHGGGLDGFLSYLLRQPDEKITMAVLINSSPPYRDMEPSAICMNLVDYMLWQKMAPQAVYSADTTLTINQLDAFTGKYDYGQGMILTVTRSDNHLIAQMTGQPAFEIFYMGKNQFYWKIVEARIQFITDEQGTVTGAIHFQGGQELKVTKLRSE
jgi:CubicO group peptidase (beta-lactamase class C family)